MIGVVAEMSIVVEKSEIQLRLQWVRCNNNYSYIYIALSSPYHCDPLYIYPALSTFLSNPSPYSLHRCGQRGSTHPVDPEVLERTRRWIGQEIRET